MARQISRLQIYRQTDRYINRQIDIYRQMDKLMDKQTDGLIDYQINNKIIKIDIKRNVHKDDLDCRGMN